MSQAINRLLSIMARLRDKENGCEWDVAQNFKTIAPYTIEEAYEVADAIERDDMADLKEELGDLLLQVVFHAQMANEEGHFAFEDVANVICNKMENRHPHIFGNEGGIMTKERWEDMKAAERDQRGSRSALDGVARALPALMRAEKLQKRAARDGFDWPDINGPAEKLAEEALELADAEQDKKLEEAGDLLFAAVNLVRAHGLSAEEALRTGNDKFERRYRQMEQLSLGSFSGLSLDAKEDLWEAVKKSEDQESND